MQRLTCQYRYRLARTRLLAWLACIATGVLPLAGLATELDYQHGFAFLSAPAYAADFTHFNYANPEAPKGGSIRIPQMGTWDTFNPIPGRGRVAAGVLFWAKDRNLIWDTLLIPALDEPASHYGLLAEGVAVADDQSWVAFKLREEARWHDGKPITTEDVRFTFNILQQESSGEIASTFKPYSLEIINDLEFLFRIPEYLRKDQTIIFTLGGIPVLPKHYWVERDITKTTVEPPLGSGPYRIGKFSVGRWTEFERVEDYWGAHLAVRKGLFNFDTVKYDYFRNGRVQTEAVKGHIVDFREEGSPRSWESSYNVPAVNQGMIIRDRRELLTPAGLWWPIFLNMKQPRFQDIRVRKALWLLRDETWSGKHNHGFFSHATSFFHGSELAATGLPDERELKLLEPLREMIPETVFNQPYTPQPNAGPGWSRQNVVEAARLLKEAGWVIENNKLIHGETREPFHIRFIGQAPSLARSLIPYMQVLKKLGITATAKAPETSNWLFTMRSGNFDAGAQWFLPSNTPTLLITNRFSSSVADDPYGANWSNLKDPAVDALIDAIRSANTWDDYVAAIHAFDRVMLHNYYYQPMMAHTHRALAYWNKFGMPEHGPLLRLAAVDNWWWDKNKAESVHAYTGGNK